MASAGLICIATAVMLGGLSLVALVAELIEKKMPAGQSERK